MSVKAQKIPSAVFPALAGMGAVGFLSLCAGVFLGVWTHLDAVGYLAVPGALTFIASVAGFLHARAEARAFAENEARRQTASDDKLFERVSGEETLLLERFEGSGLFLTLLLMFGVLAGWFVFDFNFEPSVSAGRGVGNGGLFLFGAGFLSVLLMAKGLGGAFGATRQVRAAAGWLMQTSLFALLVLGIWVTVRYGRGEGFAVQDLNGYLRALMYLFGAWALFDLLGGLSRLLYRLNQGDGIAYEGFLNTLIVSGNDRRRWIQGVWHYFFGSKTDAVRFKRRVWGGILFGLTLWVVSTSLVSIPSGHFGALDRFGVFSGSILEPGIHVKFFAPVESVRVLPLGRVGSVTAGEVLDGEGRGLWLQINRNSGRRIGDGALQLTHDDAFEPALTEAQAELFYRVSQPAFELFFEDGQGVLRQIFQNEWIAFWLNIPDSARSGSGVYEQLAFLRETLQQKADGLGLGVTLTDIVLLRDQPPALSRLPDAFRDGASAQERSAGAFSAAQIERIRLETASAIRASAVISNARREALTRQVEAAIRAERFKARLLSGENEFARRFWAIETLRTPLERVRKIFLNTGVSVSNISMELDLKEQRGPSLLDGLTE